MVRLGEEVQDKITAFRGVATAKREEWGGHLEFFVEPSVVDLETAMIHGRWFVEQRLIRREIVKSTTASLPPASSLQPNSGGVS